MPSEKGSPAERLRMARVLASEENGARGAELLWALDFVESQLGHYQRLAAEQEKIIAEKDASYELLVDRLDERDDAARNGVANPRVTGSALDPATWPRPSRSDVPARAAALKRRLAAQRQMLPHGV